MDEHKSKIVHKLVETLCLVMETPDSKMGKISEDIVPKSTFTSLKKGMDMKEDEDIFSKMKFGEDKSKSKTFSLDLDKEDKPEEKPMDMKDKPFDMGKGKGSSIPAPPLEPPKVEEPEDKPTMDMGKGSSITPPPPVEPPKDPLIMNADTKQIEPPKMTGGRRKRTKRKSKRRKSRKRLSRKR